MISEMLTGGFVADVVSLVFVSLVSLMILDGKIVRSVLT